MIVAKVAALSQKVDTKNTKEVEQVATIAANNDTLIGKKIAEAFDAVGKDAPITVEESKTINTELKIVEGMQFDQGYLSPYFSTDIEKMTCELEDPYILLYEKKISNIKDMLPLLEKIAPGKVQSPSEKYIASLIPYLSHDFLSFARTSMPRGLFVTFFSVVSVSHKQKPS